MGVPLLREYKLIVQMQLFFNYTTSYLVKSSYIFMRLTWNSSTSVPKVIIVL